MRILLATDGSEHSKLAAKMIARMSAGAPVEVDVLSVANLTLSQGPVDFDFGTSLANSVREQSESAVSGAIGILKQAGIATHQHVVEGHPAATIVEEAKDKNCDLIVMGAQGHSLMARLLLGSVSDFVATHAHCSVLIVRDSGILDTDRPMRVCIGYDDSKQSHQAIESFAQSGLAKNCHVDIVSAIALPVDNFSDIPIQIDPQEIIAAHQQLVDKAVENAQQLFGRDVAGHVHSCAHVGMGLVEFAEEHKSDLLVVGDTGRGLVARFFLGSVSRNVLRHAPCSVWVMRKPA